MLRADAAPHLDAIRQLAYRYALAVDQRDIDTLVSLYVDDVRVGDERGHDALHRFWTTSLSGIGASFLFVGNHVIDFPDDPDPHDATGSVYCIAHVDHGDHMVRQAIRYDDTYQRVRSGLIDFRWKFVYRKHLLFWGERIEPSPRDQPLANWPESQVGRGSLPESVPTWQAFWAPLGGPPGAP